MNKLIGKVAVVKNSSLSTTNNEKAVNSATNNNSTTEMKNDLQKTSTPVAEVKEQQIEVGVLVEPQNENKTTDQVNNDQARTDASSVEIKKDYTPKYTDEQKALLENVTKVFEEKILHILTSEKYHTTPYAGDTNAIIDLKKAYGDGVVLATPFLNRIHGKDQDSTGNSIQTDGAQHILIVIPYSVATAIGMQVDRFSNDQHKDDPIPDDALVILDGNGRINFLLGIPVEEWTDIYAVFPTKNAAGFYDISKFMEVINTQVSVWRTPDMVHKRMLEEGNKTHPGWALIKSLLRKGYLYQAACQIATLGNDRIKKSEVTSGDAELIFLNFEYAKPIYEALASKFGEGDDKTLKTKAFTQQISNLWNSLKNYKRQEATEIIVKFINEIPSDKAEEIKNAKAKKTDAGRISKDDRRKQLLNDLFTYYRGKNDIKF